MHSECIFENLLLLLIDEFVLVKLKVSNLKRY